MEEYYNPEPTPAPVYTNNSGGINQVYDKEVPVGAKIISVLYYINAAATLVALILTLFSLFKNRIIPTGGGFPVVTVVLITLLFAGFITFFILIAKGLWNGKGWTRITAVLLAIIALVFYLIAFAMGSLIFAVVGVASQELLKSIFTMIIVIPVNGFIAGYLLFSKKVNEAFKENIPVGVQMISVWSFFGAFICALLGIISIIGVGLISILFSAAEAGGTGIFLIVGVVILGVAVLNFFIGKDLWKAKNWARIITIIFSIIGVLGGLYTIISSFTSGASSDIDVFYSSALQTYQIFGGVMLLLLYGTIAGYLLFNKKVKEAFK